MSSGILDDIADNACVQSVRSYCFHVVYFSQRRTIGIKKWDKKKQQEGEQIKNPSRTVAVVERLQTFTAPQEFSPRGVFDGAVNFFTIKNMSQSKVRRFEEREIALILVQMFEVCMSDGKFIDFTVTMNLVGKINPNR